MPLSQLPETNWWIRFAAYGAFAAFAGVCGHLLRRIDSNEKIVWSRAIIESAAAGFVGVLVLMACQAMGMSEAWTGVIVGVSGWLGASATIRMLEQVIRKKLGLDNPQISGDYPNANYPNGVLPTGELSADEFSRGEGRQLPIE